MDRVFDIRQFLQEITDQSVHRFRRMMKFLEKVEEDFYDPEAVSAGLLKPREIEKRAAMASKAAIDMWAIALKQQMSPFGQQVPDEMEAIYYRILSLSEHDLDRLQALLKLFSSNVPIDRVLALAESEERESVSKGDRRRAKKRARAGEQGGS